ncbi:MAG: hypothetical protein Q8Q14_06930, partial [Gemmatimonadales bacterium]|nr:hypothetical protein [Gemmatimonadales bacterium]
RVWSGWSLAAAAALAGVLLLRPAGDGSGLHAQLAQAKRQSATLEQQLERFNVDSLVLSGRAAAMLAELEDRITAIDRDLARAPRNRGARDAALVELWEERVDLMRELVNVRATRARYVGL